MSMHPINPGVLPQVLLATGLLMMLNRVLILSESRHYRRVKLRHVIAFWIGFVIVGLCAIRTRFVSKLQSLFDNA